MKKIKRPLNRSVLIGTISFIAVLCVLLSVGQYFRYRKILYAHYKTHIENILNYVSGNIDTDDLAECIRTGKTSRKYNELQKLLDSIRDQVDIHNIYVIEPLNTEPTDNIKNIITGASQYEYENMADRLVQLNTLTGDAYSPETAKKYLDAYNTGKLSFFEEVCQWGDEYIGLLPLYDSGGNRIAALCVDVDIDSIRGELFSNTVTTVLAIALLGIIFILIFFFWIARNVTHPLEQLENGVTEFTLLCQTQKNPSALKLKVPTIRTGNEVESLAAAVTTMCETLQGYVKNVVYTKSELAKMAMLANKDPLTGIRNKDAFDAYAQDLETKMSKQGLRFAIVMANLNGLKGINDLYGHEKGDIYIQQGCRLICKIFSHSAVFRTGADEFVAVMFGQDYENRAWLLQESRTEFGKRSVDQSLVPWERCSAAFGIAEYSETNDSSIEELLDQASKDVYAQKSLMKQ